MKKVFSLRNSNEFVKGEFFVTYSAVRNGKKYITVHLNPCGNIKNDSCITADSLNYEWNKKYKGFCPFNGDTDFQVLKIQQRF